MPSTKALRDPNTPKVDLPGPLLEFDYLMYKVKCPQTALPKKLVTDHLAGGRINLFGPPFVVLVPATKQNPPCGQVSAGQCGGECPTGEACRLSATGACGCAPPPRHCGRDAWGTCGGECPSQDLLCEMRLGADGIAQCGCFQRLAGCGLAAGANQCGGACPQGESCKTFITPNGGVTCDCVN